MREYHAELKVNDGETGELLEKVSAIFYDKKEEFDNAEDVGNVCGGDIEEYLTAQLEYDYTDDNVITRLNIVELQNEYPEED